MSQKLCQLMGGEMAAESELGRGSCFTMRRPASAQDGKQANIILAA